jgi:hypothetical protein
MQSKRKFIFILILLVILISSSVVISNHYLNQKENKIHVSINAKYKTLIPGSKDYFNSSVNGGEAPYTYSWSVYNVFSSSHRNINLTFYTPGIQIVSLSVTSHNNKESSSYIIINVVSTSVYITSSANKVSAGQNITFYAHIDGGIKPFKYYWSINHKVINNENRTLNYDFRNAGNYTISLNVSNDNRFNASTFFTFNPWNFNDTYNNYSIRDQWGNGNNMIDDQPYNYNGTLIFHFYLYNPLNQQSDNNITVDLYNKLPVNGPESIPLKNFTFSSGTISGNAGKWVTINTNINWNYSYLAVLPAPQTGQNGSSIGVALPAHFNEIYSHYWFDAKSWDPTDDGLIGYWSISKDINIKVT